MERFAFNVIVDVAKKIVVRGDTERRRAAVPFNHKRTVTFNVRKLSDRPLIGYNVTVAANARPVTTGNKKGNNSNKRDVNLLHGKKWFH